MKWILFFAAASAAFAQRPLPEELAIARSITMQEPGEIQLTPALQYFKLPDAKELTCALDAEYGFSDRLELDAEVPYVFRNPNDGGAVNGLGDAEFAVRYAFVPMTEKPFAFNAGLSVTTPTGSRRKELGEGRVALGPFFTASRWVGAVNLQLNGGWSRAVSNGGEEPRDEFEYNVALLYPIRDWFLVIEGNGESTRRQTRYYVTPEIVWRPKREFQVELAAPVGVTRAAGAYGVVASVSFEFDTPLARGGDRD
jgi:hypothetical protein